MGKLYKVSGELISKRAQTLGTIWGVSAGAIVLMSYFFTKSQISLWMALAAIVAVYYRMTDQIEGSLKEENNAGLELVDEGIKYHYEANEAVLKFGEVEALEVKSTSDHPVSLIFSMNDKAKHEIKYYEGLNEMLMHCLKEIPLSKVRYT